MYAKVMTTNDIENHLRELYDLDISDILFSNRKKMARTSVKKCICRCIYGYNLFTMYIMKDEL